MKRILITIAAVFVFASCTMDFYRSDTMTSAMLGDNPAAAVYTTDGNYSMLKDEVEYSNTRSGNDFARLYFLMHELRGDNVSLCAKSTDPLFEDLTYKDDPTKADLSYMWFICYKIIYGCNANIESMIENQDAATDHLIGENYFLRAFCHFTLCNLFATPYSRGPEKLGVVIRTSTDVSVTKRATVSEVYTQIVKDLQDARRLMAKGTSRGNKGYASYDAATGLLTRVYLYMGENQLCADLCDEMLAGSPFLDNVATYYANTLNSEETLWCIGKSATDPSFLADGTPSGELASIYYTPEGTTVGWNEQGWSEPLIELIMRHPEDNRTAHFHQFAVLNDGKKMITYPLYDPDNNFRLQMSVRNVDFDETADVNTFTRSGVTYEVRSKKINGYPAYYITNMHSDDVDKDDIEGGTRCYVRNNAKEIAGFYSKVATAPVYAMSKFSGQDGNPMLSSPAIIRWAEIYLNRAEANAKLGGKDQEVLADINKIRERAGIPTWKDAAHWQSEGYKDLLDVVLDERRLELCFEGHRALDLYRNNRPIDRRFGGAQAYEILTPDDLDTIFPYCIPFEETSVSQIPGNGKN